MDFKRSLFIILVWSFLFPSLSFASATNFSTKPVKTDFNISDSPQIGLTSSDRTVKTFFGLFSKKIPPLNLETEVQYILTDPQGKTVPSSGYKIVKNSPNSYSFTLNSTDLTPGKYSLKITDPATGETTTQDFTWGVLALNLDQSVYRPGDTARIAIAVLDDLGEMVCDADVKLTITLPDGTTQSVPVIQNPVCHTKEITLIPDFESRLPISATGTYRYTLTATTKNGTHNLSGDFEAQTNPEFVVKRLAATRIYPPNLYPVQFSVISSKNITGSVVESVPTSFKISQTSAKVTVINNRQFLTWPVNLKAGSSATFAYSYHAPLISPEFYTLGPLEIKNSQNPVYIEPRSWQIASDATATLTTTDTQWIVPANVFVLTKVEAWAGGGGGATRGTSGLGGGGGGGAYSNLINYSVTPGATLAVSVGAGGAATANGNDTYFINSDTLLAKAGLGATLNSAVGASGGQASSGVGNTKWSGGAGANPSGVGTSYGGGGGGGAGDAANGGIGSTSAGGLGGAGIGYSGGNGGNGRQGTQGAGSDGTVPGGGGGGAYRTSGTRAGGAGANGQIIITYTVNQSPTTPVLISPDTGTTNVSQTPTFTTVTTDPESDPLQYELKICTDSGMSTGCQTFDQSISNVGWSGQDVGTSAFNSGTTATYILQAGDSLATSNTYYWKTRAKDPTRTNTWSPTQTTAYSFTTLAGANQSPTAPTSLLVEGQSSPALGLVDTTPEFSAIYNDPDASDQADKYQIQVDNDSGFGSVLWDSGGSGTSFTACNQGARCSDISYAGSALTRGTTYYWRIKFWDLAGETSPWSGGTPSFTINQTPNKPALISPDIGATGVSQTPSFQTVVVDPDSNPVQFKLEICTDSGMSTGCQTFDQSISNVGWSGQDVGTSAFNSGTTATYILQAGNSLAANSTYYWRTSAKDPTGSNIWSSTTSVRSFTTASASNQPPTAPTNLKVGGTASPVLGLVDTTPDFTAQYNDPDTSDQADKYQIVVDDDSGFGSPIWDSGGSGTSMTACNQGTTCPAVTYAGSALSWGTTYYWRIKFWDLAGDTSPWSAGTPNFTTNDLPGVPARSEPADTATNQSVTPAFKTVATDADSDTLQYKLIYCTNAGMSVGCTTPDQTVSNTNWTGQNVGTSAYSSGSTATYTIPVASSLPENQTIYWKTQAIDPYGTNIYGSTQAVAFSFTTGSRPNTPTLTSPGNGTTNVSTSPALSTVATDNNSDPLQYKIELCTNVAMSVGCTTYDQTSGNTGWSNQNVGTSAYSSGTTATYTIQTSLGTGTTYYWQSYAIDYSGLNRWSSTQGSPNSFVTQAANQSPSTPTNSSPANGASGISLTPILIGSSFSDPDPGDTHQASQWQVATDTGFSNIVFDTGTTGIATSSVTVTTTLSVGTTYYWKFRYQDNHNAWSSYSSYTNFTTNKLPNTPTLISPANSATGVTTTPKLTLVTTDPDANNVQYRIFLATDAAFTGTTQTFNLNSSQVGWSGINVGTSAYSSGTTAAYTVQSALNYSTLYYWKAQAIDPAGTNQWGNLSAGSSFTTMSAPNQTPTAPTSLLVEAQSSPTLGLIDTTPEFSAVYNDPDGSDQADKYQIQVDDDSGFGSALWDSGNSGTAMTACNQGARCSDISYAGSALTRGTTYYWRIKFWDLAGETSPWSAGTPSFTINSLPNSPTLTSPANSATGVTTFPTLKMVATDNDNNPLQYRIFLATDAAFSGTTQTFDQTVSNVGWSAADVGTSAYNSGTTAAYIIQSGLSNSTTYYWKSQAQDYSGSNTWSSLSIGYSFTTVSAPNSNPSTPTNSSPADGTSGVSLTPPLTASAFSDPDGGDTQSASQWQVATDTGFTSIVFDTGTTGAGTTSVTVTTSLSVGTTYYFHVRYQDNHGAWSSYSSYTNFTTNKLPNTPTNSTPATGTTAVSITPQLTSSAFSDPDAGDTHAASQWKISTQTGGSFDGAVVWDSGSSGQLTSITVSPALNYSTLYYWKVRHQDSAGNWSSYSSPTSFTTTTAPANLPATPHHYWKFDEGYGSTTYDQTGAASTFSATWSADGKYSRALSFNGTSSRVDIGTTSGLDFGSTSFAITAWIKPTTTTGIRPIFSNSKGFFYVEDNYLKFQRSTAPWETITSGSTIPVNTWSHVAIIRTSTSSNETYLYLNGRLTQIGTIPDLGSGATSLYVGYQSGNNAYFSGLIDDLKTYTSTLTLNQVLVDYNHGSFKVFGSLTQSTTNISNGSYNAQYCPPGDSATCNGPTVEYKFEEAVGTTAFDTSSNSHHGQLGTGSSAPGRLSGKIGKAINFDGTNDYFTFTENLFYNQTGMSISAWFKTSDSNGAIVTEYNTSGAYTYKLVIKNGVLEGCIGDGFPDGNCNATNNMVGGNTSINDNRWHFAALTYDGAQVRLFLDGVNISTTSKTGNIILNSTTNSYVGVQGYLSGSTIITEGVGYLRGAVDQLQFFNYGRTPAQVAWDYNRGQPQFQWKFEECSGATVANSTQIGYTGSLSIGPGGSQNAVGTCTTGGTARGVGTTGKFNNYLSFDGNDDNLLYGDLTSYEFGDGRDFTISMWIKSDLTTSGTILSKKTSTLASSSGYQLDLSSAGSLTFYTSDGAAQYQISTANGSVASNTWAHVTIIFDDNSTANTNIFINGSNSTSSTTGTLASVTDIGVNTRELTVASESDSQNYFKGSLDDLRIYPYSLTPIQVRQNYNGAAVYLR